MEIRIEKLSSNDIHKFTELIRVFEQVFEMRNFVIPGEKHLRQLLTRDDFMAFVAVSNDKVVGGLTSYILHQYYSVSPLVYIYDLAVKSKLQRQGVGKLLMANLTNYCKDNGFEEMFVQADKVDDHAIEFYRSTGATEEQVVHFYYPLVDKT